MEDVTHLIPSGPVGGLTGKASMAAGNVIQPGKADGTAPGSVSEQTADVVNTRPVGPVDSGSQDFGTEVSG